MIDYVDWVGCVLDGVAGARTAADDGSRREPFLRFPSICAMMGLDASSSVFGETEVGQSVICALLDLEAEGLVKLVEHPLTYQVTEQGRKGASLGLQATWSAVFAVSADLDEEQLLVLHTVVEKGQVVENGYVRVREVPLAEVQGALGGDWLGPRGRSKVWHIYSDLVNLGLLRGRQTIGDQSLRPTYRGVVRATRKQMTELQALVGALLPDWESTNVDFKRELHLERDKEKAEFVRDVVALANTKSPGRRFLVIGFGPKSRTFEMPADSSINQDRLENILNAYADPAPRVLYATVPWQTGHAGLIEVVREPRLLPYKIKKNIAHLRAGEVYVRHGSHTESPSTDELASLEAEGAREREQAG